MHILEMKGINKRFGPVIANDQVDFSLRRGEIHALLGENGAGKTTLMRILYGLYKADDGEIYVDDKLIRIQSPKDAIDLGIGMVTQHFALVPPFSVAENVVMGFTDGIRLDMKSISDRVAQAAKKYSMDIVPDALVRHLSVGQKQRVEILKALFREARVLILDEPTAVLIPQEVDALFDILRKLKDDGISVIFISHKMNEVQAISDRVTILRDGRKIATENTAETSPRELARMMVGRETFGVMREGEVSSHGAVLTLEDVCADDDRGLRVLKDVSFSLKKGEIFSIAGVSGNGQKELAEVLCGLRRLTHGRFLVKGEDVSRASASALNQMGIGRIPEDRYTSVVGELTVAENLVLEHLSEFTRNGVLDRKAMSRHAQLLIDQFEIKAQPKAHARTLSGGNLQKLLLARVLVNEPEILIAPQPTRGLDVGATEYVHNQLLQQRQRGAGVLLISEDLDEILALSDRIAVIYEGEIVGILPVQKADVELLGLMMSGAAKENDNVAAQV